MFRGQYKYSIDTKGRVSIPARLRKHVSADANDTFVITKGRDNCIDVYPLDEWNLLEEKLLKLNPFDPDDVKFIRMISQFATEMNLDAQARILIPQNLLEYSKIEKEVLVLGALKKIELWNPDIYENYIKQTEESYEQIAAKVMAMK